MQGTLLNTLLWPIWEKNLKKSGEREREREERGPWGDQASPRSPVTLCPPHLTAVEPASAWSCGMKSAQL